MRSCLIALCVTLYCLGTYAQTKGYSRYSNGPPESIDTSTIDGLVEASVSVYLQSPDSARALAEQALILSKQIDYQTGIGESFAAIGYSYWAQSYYALSLYYLFNAEDYLVAANRYKSLSMCYRIIARNYIELGKNNLAKSYLQQSEKQAGLSQDNHTMAIIYNESSLIDLHEKNFTSALQKGKTALQLSFKYSDTLLTGIIYARLGDVFKDCGDYNSAKAYYDSAYQWSVMNNNKRLKSFLLNNFAVYYMHVAQYNQALSMAAAASAMADSTGNISVKLTAAALMVDCMHALKDVNKELQYRTELNALQDSSIAAYREKGFEFFEQFFSLNSKLHRYEVQQHQNAISRQKLSYQHVIIIVLVMFIIILLAGLAVIYYLYKEKKMLADQLVASNAGIMQQKDIIQEQSQHLEELNNLKTKLFAVISHDLRTPITSLRSIMGLFQQHDLNEEQTALLLKKMLPALDGADLTLSNLLNWSVKQMDGLKINRANVVLFPLVQEIGRVFEFVLNQKNISFINNISPITKAYFDEQHLTIIFRNLVSNAIKFTSKNGSITITSKIERNKIIVTVQDTGQGITQENLARLFISNTHFTSRGTGGEKGTGLGLLLCKELLELNGGYISVQSIPGKGSAFSIELNENERG